ncbi:DNA methylase N-4/N-6 [Salinisphaera shabanensis T35B1]|uniref:site-specific DNA-methyltransferase n=1 Tax=Salinisphaera shabanensis TaxID=180542 RepID=UPI00333EEFB0
MDKLDPKTDGASQDIVADNIDKLRELFPDAFTEGSDANGPRWKVDFDALKACLGEYVEDERERYSFTWNGKARARRIAHTPSAGTLRPCPEESVNWDTTQNLFIEGDNLEVLKLLQKSYHKQVKMIYIDPPYNTGGEFIYPDRFQDNLETYLRYTGQVDGEGFKTSANAESAGRYHTNWLNMMYPRLRLARNLLRDDGVVFISIDDNEDTNLRKIADEIFGEENFIAKIIIQSNKRGQTYKKIAKCHEYVFIYGKTDIAQIGELEKAQGSLPYTDSHGDYDLWELRNRNPKFGKHNRPNLYFPIYINPEKKDENGLHPISLEERENFKIKVFPTNSKGEEGCWRWSAKKIRSAQENDGFGATAGKRRQDGGWNIYEKSRKNTTKAKSIWADTQVISEQGTVEAGRLGMSGMLEHPKPVELIRRCIELATEENDLVLDFFAGSGTTAHALFKQCALDHKDRRLIAVQLPEPTYEIAGGNRVAKANSNKAFENGYLTIADIAKQRIRRSIRAVKEENPDIKLGFGIKVFRLDTSNLIPWNPTPEELNNSLFRGVDNIRLDRSEQDVLSELLLKYGLDLAEPIEEREINGKALHIIGAGALVVCLADAVDLELVNGIAALKAELAPEVMRVVFKDNGFANDVVKTNAVQILRQAGVEDVKSL